jgi:hypothetical protein
MMALVFNGERRTENGERRTENGERRTENGELAFRVDAEAAPGFGYHDAVAGIVGIVANLDGKIDAEVADVLSEAGDILHALVTNTGDAVLIVEDAGWRLDPLREDLRVFICGTAACALVEGVVDEGGVGDAATFGEELPAQTLDLFGVGFAMEVNVEGDAGDSGDAKDNRADAVWG